MALCGENFFLRATRDTILFNMARCCVLKLINWWVNSKVMNWKYEIRFVFRCAIERWPRSAFCAALKLKAINLNLWPAVNEISDVVVFFLSARQYAQRSRGCIESLRPTINWFFLFIAKKTEIELMYLSIDCQSWHRSECHKTANRVNWIEEEISQLVLIARKNRHFCEIF